MEFENPIEDGLFEKYYYAISRFLWGFLWNIHMICLLQARVWGHQDEFCLSGFRNGHLFIFENRKGILEAHDFVQSSTSSMML